MKKVAFILSVVFVAVLGMNTYASTVVVDDNTVITVVDLDQDKKPCPADCKGECCAKKAETKTADMKAGNAKAADCKIAKTSECASKCASSCGGKKASATKTTEVSKEKK
ncbi:MAG: hypothetical protein JEZ09_13675 [Salinivirgaceae bacterium]|nr:hypothetical protein [Salinivirgaceae bacterium]